VKILSSRTWRGVWRVETQSRAGEHGLSSAALHESLAALTQMAQQRAPDAAKSLYDRSVAIAATQSLLAVAPRTRAD
jgi:hypothetical protein